MIPWRERCYSGLGRMTGVLALLCLAWVQPPAEAEGPVPGGGMRPVRLRCGYRNDPLGIDERRPRLSWELEAPGRGRRQTGYRILVADSLEELQRERGELWDSGIVESPDTLNIVYSGRPITSGMRCFWKVRVWDETGRFSGWSEPAWWESGLLHPSDWRAEWLSDGRLPPANVAEFDRDDPAPLFRKEFVIDGQVLRARLYISGLGYYEARLNGRRIGDRVLDPGWTDTRDRILYSTYDVTPLLREGSNALGVILGNGWFNPLPLRMWGRIDLREALPVGRPCFIARLAVTTVDGRELDVVSDPTWKTRAGPILRNNVYLGEVYDARREISGWDRPGLDETDWRAARTAPSPGGRLWAQSQPPVRITQELPAVALTSPADGVSIFDFGENFTGWTRLRLRAPRGTHVRMRFGELLHPDGRLNPMTSVCGQIKGRRKDGTRIGGAASPEIAWQGVEYIARGGGEEAYTPRFTYHGFRYAEVTGLPGRPELGDLTGLRLHSAVEDAGTFECSSELLNRIQAMCRRTFLSNLISVQSDCPHREKFGYGGDLVATSDAFIYNFDMANFYAKAVGDWRDAARPDGMLTDTAPFVGIQYCGIPWAMAHPHLLSQLYKYYGDRSLVREHYPTARRWLELEAVQNPELIVERGLSDHEGLEPAPPPAMVTPFYFRSAELLARLAGILGQEADRRRFLSLRDDIRRAYLHAFLEPGTGRFVPFTQASQVFALHLGLAPDSERSAALAALLEKLREGRGLTTGIFGTRYLPEVLSRAGHADEAAALILRKSYPGWGYMLEMGATTVWEHWAFSDDTYSHNHPMFGSVSGWFYAWLAGIQPHPAAVGFDRIVLRPQPVASLDWVKAAHRTVRGEIRSGWRREGGRVDLTVEVPPNTRAEIHIPHPGLDQVLEGGLPAGQAEAVRFLHREGESTVFQVESGRYVFSFPAKKSSDGGRNP